MTPESTGAAGKAPMKTLLAPYEKQFITWLTPYFPKWIVSLLPWILGIALVMICVITFRTQKFLWKLDMENEQNAES